MLVCLSVLIFAPLAQAHPHVFVETELRLVADSQGHLNGVEVSWQYDELYSLLLLEDLELDDDYDGILKDAEIAQLDGFDLNWVQGFAGDLFAVQGGQSVPLSAPENRGVRFENGKITSSHFRSFPAGADILRLKAFDPTFYTAYEVAADISVPEHCRVEIRRADLDHASKVLELALADLPPDPEDYPAVGEVFADEVIVSCADY